MVLAEAMAARLPIVASTSGAIPEVCAGDAAHFAPGDWIGLARALAAPPAAPAGARYTASATADGLAAAYDEVLSRST
jgi:glycosyltransferase involved in cell wall biosynthesis